MSRIDEQPAVCTAGRSNAFVKFVPFGIVLAGLVAGYVFNLHHFLSLQQLADHRHELQASVAAHPLLAAAAFFVVYVLVVTFSFPVASILTIFAGFLFGWVAGTAIVAVAATTGASILFLAARNACAEAIRKKAGPFLDRFAAGFRADAFNYLLILRLAPLCPFFLVNIAPAFFNVSFRTYVAATFLGILPATFVFTCLGGGLDGAIVAAESSGQPLAFSDFATPTLALSFVGLAVIAAIPLVVRRWWCHDKAGGCGEK